jgi:uracil-DNA glycosylase
MSEVQIEKSWKALLKDEFDQDYFQLLIKYLKKEKEAGKQIFPVGGLIFNAFALTPVKDVKVVIIGQDPYHNPNEAMGLSFSVPKGVKIPPSLKNIFKELNGDLGIEIASHGDLTSWAKQGVFLLNAFLTVEVNKPLSHSKIGWDKFTSAVIKKLSEECDHVVFMLWGNFAKSKSELIDQDKHLILASAHPSPLAGKAFFGNHHFSLANQYLKEKGKAEIDWSLLGN